MSDQIVTEDVHPVKAGLLDDYIKLLQKDPNFHLLPLPESVRERFNIPLEYKPLSLKESSARALATRTDYTGYEVIDQTGADIQFPPIPESAPAIEAIVTEPQELEDQSSPLPSENDAECKEHEHVQQSSCQEQSAEEVK